MHEIGTVEVADGAWKAVEVLLVGKKTKEDCLYSKKLTNLWRHL